MARINIEERWWNDPRRRTLRNLLGRDATEQVVVNAWRTACDYWCSKEGTCLVPGHVFIHFDGWKELLQSGLASIYDTKAFQAGLSPAPIQHNPTDPSTIQQSYIYLSGLKDSFSNFIETRQKKSIAGQKSAERGRDELGRLLNKSGLSPASTNTDPTQSNTHQLSVSVSVSKKKKNGLSKKQPQEQSFDFEEIYSAYPKRDGSQRKQEGLRVCEAKIKTEEQYLNLKKAVDNYSSECDLKKKTGTDLVMQFKTFMSNVWEEYIHKDQPTLTIISPEDCLKADQHV